MDSEIISMSDMMAIYDVTDRFDIDREQKVIDRLLKKSNTKYIIYLFVFFLDWS